MNHHTLRHCCLIPANIHHSLHTLSSCEHDDVLCEAMLPDIRLIATMIASSRHDLNQPHVHQFTDEADWFAARLLVLNVRVFHLDSQLLPMLNLANERAASFAKIHHLPFQPATIHTDLPNHHDTHMVLMECDLSGQAHRHWLENTQAVRAQLTPHLCKLMHGKVKNFPKSSKCSIVNA